MHTPKWHSLQSPQIVPAKESLWQVESESLGLSHQSLVQKFSSSQSVSESHWSPSCRLILIKPALLTTTSLLFVGSVSKERVMTALLPPEIKIWGSGGIKITVRGLAGERLLILTPFSNSRVSISSPESKIRSSFKSANKTYWLGWSSSKYTPYPPGISPSSSLAEIAISWDPLKSWATLLADL